MNASRCDVRNDWLHAKEPKLIYQPVPKTVGSPKNDSPELVEPISP